MRFSLANREMREGHGTIPSQQSPVNHHILVEIHSYAIAKNQIAQFFFRINLVPIRVVLSMTDEYWLTDASFSINS
ncbi:hypothetical protein [Nostoc linckia]|uniref:hypothetical protein n=1 Tax=Nostoc linckia TaxID=92942 RepID=UPI000C000A7B|nr:hypothetical protein [Nostoc linckia]